MYKIHKNKNLFKYLNYVLIGHKKFDKWKKEKNISKRLLNTRFNFDFSKVHNYHLIKISQKK
jgi:hypothetical protein